MSYESNAEPIKIRRLDADGVNSHLVDRFGEE
jgi:hypothetical protein